MQLYLVQHGEAQTEQVDPDRPLTPKGRADVARVAALAAKLGVRVTEILHSDKRRAIETAEEFSRALGAPRRQLAEVGPNDDINPMRREASSRTESYMLVGHLPFLSRLAGNLVCLDESLQIVTFQVGGLVRLDRHADGRFSVVWAIPPEAV